MREHQDQRTSCKQNDRELRQEAFEILMKQWSRIDEKQRRTWLAWITGQLPVESLNALKVRLTKKEPKS